MAYHQIVIGNYQSFGAINSSTVNLSGPQTPMPYLLWLWLKKVSESADEFERGPVTTQPERGDSADYNENAPFSFGELCNTSVYDDSANKALEDLVKRVLGARVADRFAELRRIKPGWDFGEGEALHDAALSNLSALLSQTKVSPRSPKLFLSSDGSLELRWRSKSDDRICLFVKDDRFEVFDPNGNGESVFMDSEVQSALRSAGLLG